MSAREFAAGFTPAMAGLDDLPRDPDPCQRTVALAAEVEVLRGALAKIRELAAAGGSAPGLLALVAETAEQALAGAR